MKPIAIFYHCRMSGGDPVIHAPHATGIMLEQMDALVDYGLFNAAQEMIVGVCGGDADYQIARTLVPQKSTLSPSVIKHADSNESQGEVPTLRVMMEWIKSHPDWYVFYHHIKGATHPEGGHYVHWRHRMCHHLVKEWSKCVADLDASCDAVGCHWMTPEQFPGAVGTPIFGGNFWWAKSDFLATLPDIKTEGQLRGGFYEAEAWIGRGPRRPVVKDYHPGWP